MFQNQDQQSELRKEVEVTLKQLEDEHRTKERELKTDNRGLQVQVKYKIYRISLFFSNFCFFLFFSNILFESIVCTYKIFLFLSEISQNFCFFLFHFSINI